MTSNTWDEYFELRDADGPLPDDFMSERPMNVPTEPRKLFEEQ